MFNPQSPPEQLFFSTTLIEVENNSGLRGSGTGFLYQVIQDTSSIIFLVTNKHVINEAKRITLQFNLKENGKPAFGKTFGINVHETDQIWIPHPSDDIDIAIMPFGPILNELREKNIQIYYKAIDSELIPSETIIRKDIDGIEEVIFFGYPNNIFDRKNLIPVGRRGITATPFQVDFEQKPVFLIDASVFPGSSGSPVFICTPGYYYSKSSGATNFGQNKIFFLGILTASYFRKENNLVRSMDIPTFIVPFVTQKEMIDIGIVIKSHILHDFVLSILESRGIDNNPSV